MVDALSTESEYADVQIITLKQWLYEQACEEAWDKSIRSKNHLDLQIKQLLATKYTHAKEFVYISPKGIQVGVNVERVDDHAVDKALVLLTQVDELMSGKEKRYEFGNEVRINDSKH